MTTDETFPVLGPDGHVTYMTFAALPADVHLWDYWAKDPARSHFRFELVPTAGAIRIYIVAQPSYQGRPAELVPTHRLQDAAGSQYICISSGHEPRTVAEAITWYAYWAEQTVQYIATGRAFS